MEDPKTPDELWEEKKSEEEEDSDIQEDLEREEGDTEIWDEWDPKDVIV